MRKLLSILFCILLIVPAVVWLIGLDFGINVNRVGVEFPLPYGRALLNNEYYRSFDQYFNDRFSMRDPLTITKNWLDFNVFGMTDAGTVHVGTNGWLYSRKSIEDYRKEACSEENEVGWLFLQLHALEKIIKTSGRRFFFIVAPNKPTIYPEFVGPIPESNGCKYSRYDLFMEDIAAHPLQGFVRLDESLRNAKKPHSLLYDKTSTHWNGLGAKVAAETIHGQIGNNDTNIRQLVYRSIDDRKPGDLITQVMGLSSPDEDEPSGHPEGSGRPDFPSGIVYGDSFLRNLIPYMAQMFQHIDILPAERIPSMQNKENWLDYDCILIETVESGIGTLSIDLDTIFSRLEAQAKGMERKPLDLLTVVPVSQTSLDLKPHGLEIKSLGKHSACDIISVTASDDNIYRVLKLSITAPQSGLMTIQYLGDRHYGTTKSLKPGLTDVYLPLPFQPSPSIRLYPGMNAGLFTLNSAEILGFPSHDELILKDITIAQPSEDGRSLPPKVKESPETMVKPTVSAVTGKTSPERTPDVASEQQADGAPARAKPELLTAGAKKDVPIPVSAAPKTATHTQSERNVPVDAVTPPTATPSIAVTDFDDGRIFQRRGGSAGIVVSGTYKGRIGSVEARVVRDGSSREVVPWTVIDGSPKNGIFVGKLAPVPQGGWYNIQVRDGTNHTISSKGSHQWGVGILFGCLGQSNMKEWFHKGNSLNAHALLRKYTEKGWAPLGNRGHAAIVFGNRIIQQLGIPMGLLDFSVNGSGLRKEADFGTGYWENTARGSIYNRFVAGISETGGSLEYVIWIQGEAEAASGRVTESEYRQSLESFITNQVRKDIVNSSGSEYLPFLIIQMVKRPGGKNNPHQAVRNAQKYVAENLAECYLAATTLDLKNEGKQHLSPDAYITMGGRVAQTVLYISGEETYFRGPSVKAVTRADDKTIDVTISHRGGMDFTPVSGITGWEVLENGKSVPVDDVYRYDPQTIRIVLKRPIGNKVTIRYLYGAMPDATNPVKDDSAMSLPLEEYQSEIHFDQ
jgi:hypothetical protein